MTYIDLAMLKSAFGATDNDRDALFTQAITASCGSIDERTGRSFDKAVSATPRVYRTKGRTMRLDVCSELLLIDDIADVTGLVVEGSFDGLTWATIDPTTYEIGPDNAISKNRPVTQLTLVYNSWMLYRRVRVTAIWGWPEVPASIKQAALLQASRLYKRKDSPDGTAGSAEWGVIRVSHLDPDVKALIEPYRIPGFGGGS